ncbi:MAG: hypothetical protein AVDCRST_MAG76-2030, partial [uncultured Acidimicrobiales bacterium]
DHHRRAGARRREQGPECGPASRGGPAPPPRAAGGAPRRQRPAPGLVLAGDRRRAWSEQADRSPQALPADSGV